jgi:hypothetical protein
MLEAVKETTAAARHPYLERHLENVKYIREKVTVRQ